MDNYGYDWGQWGRVSDMNAGSNTWGQEMPYSMGNNNNNNQTGWMDSLLNKDTMLGTKGSAGLIGLGIQGASSFLNWSNGKDMKELGRDQLNASNKFNTINVNNSAISYDAQAQQQWETQNAHRANSGLPPLAAPEKMQRLS